MTPSKHAIALIESLCNSYQAGPLYQYPIHGQVELAQKHIDAAVAEATASKSSSEFGPIDRANEKSDDIADALKHPAFAPLTDVPMDRQIAEANKRVAQLNAALAKERERVKALSNSQRQFHGSWHHGRFETCSVPICKRTVALLKEGE